MDLEAWARKNKKQIAREFIRRTHFVKSDNPAAIFTAGLPGAGKTEFTVELIKQLTNYPVRIDMDEIASQIEGYKPNIADKFRGSASIILSRIYDEVIKNKLDFIFDGTFAHGRALENITRAITHDYTVKVYFIHQDPVIAWQFTKDRELVEHRAIDRSGFIDTYFKLKENITNLCNNYKDVTISLIIKDSTNKEGKRIEDVPNLLERLNFLTAEELKSTIK